MLNGWMHDEMTDTYQTQIIKWLTHKKWMSQEKWLKYKNV
jgi:hypothetical protein